MITSLSEDANRAAAEARIEEIFFLSSGTGSGLAGAARTRFLARWTGYYLDDEPGQVLLYRTGAGVIAGYLTGCLDSAGAARLYQDIDHYRLFEGFFGRFPAHFHVNCHPAHRNRGIGSALVAAFVERCVVAGLAGVHLVTAADARNRRFYARAGFGERARGRIAHAELLLLGRSL